MVSKIARLIHQRSGHVENHAGSGGCFEVAEVIVAMFPTDAIAARVELEELAILRTENEALWKRFDEGRRS
jgi:hypothetical protein